MNTEEKTLTREDRLALALIYRNPHAPFVQKKYIPAPRLQELLTNGYVLPRGPDPKEAGFELTKAGRAAFMS